MDRAVVTTLDTSDVGFDPRDASVMQCPFPHYARLREGTGITELPGEYVGRPGERVFAVSRFDLVNEVLHDWRTYSSRFGTPSAAAPAHLVGELREIAAKGLHRPPTMLTADPPVHTRFRRLVAQAFTPRRVAELGPVVERICDDLLDRLVADPAVTTGIDLVAAYAVSIPARTMAAILGIPQERYADFKRWADASIASIGRQLSDDEWRENTRRVVELQQYFAFELGLRRADPVDDFLTDLVFASLPDDAEGGGGPLSVEEMVSIIQQLVVAGSETTVSLVADAVRLLADVPSEWQRLATEPERAGAVVEECVRLASPNLGMFRVVTQDTELNGVPIPQGSTMWVLFASANRDRAEFGPTADDFDPDREHLQHHVGFGRGVHYCLGAPLARLEASIALRRLAGRFATVELVDPHSLRYAPSCVLRGLERLDVRLTPR